MIHNRRSTIAYVTHDAMENLRYWLEESASTAAVGINIHTRPGDGMFCDCLLVTIDAWSGNEGSVDDFYRSLLAPISRGADVVSVTRISRSYIERVKRWCEGVNHFFAARARDEYYSSAAIARARADYFGHNFV